MIFSQSFTNIDSASKVSKAVQRLGMPNMVIVSESRTITFRSKNDGVLQAFESFDETFRLNIVGFVSMIVLGWLHLHGRCKV